MRRDKFITFIYVISLLHFFPSLLILFSASLKILTFRAWGEIMSNIDALTVAQRIDTVLDILVAGDYHSAIRNLEILKSEFWHRMALTPHQKTHSLKPRGKCNHHVSDLVSLY
jgi:hypothetical protein